MGVTLSRELLEAARSGDRSAYNQVGTWLISELVAYHRGQGSGPDVAAERAQETALRMLEKLDEAPDDPERFRASMIGFARKVAKEDVNRQQRRAGKRAVVELQPRTPARRPDSLLALRRLFAWIQAEIDKFPSPYRRTLELMLSRDDGKQIAEVLDVPEGTVRRRMWWIRRRIESARARHEQT